MKMSKFFPAAERRTSENGAETELERESIFPEQETQEKLQIYLQKKWLPIFLKLFRRICILQMI